MEQETSTQQPSRFTFSENTFAYFGLGIALIAAIVLFYESDVMSLFQPKKEQTTVEKVLDIIIKDSEPEPKPEPVKLFSTTAIVLAFSGLILSLVAFGRKENKGLTWSAASLSVGVLGWQFIIAYLIAQILPAIVFILILMLIGGFLLGGAGF